MKLEKSGHVVPYPQKALDNELGLTAADIAMSLRVAPRLVRQKIQRHKKTLSTGIFRSTHFEYFNENGVLFREVALNVHASKYVVATWKNDMGVGYFQYLLECEQIAEKMVPGLKDTIREYEKKLSKVNKSKGYIKVPKPEYQTNIFGEQQLKGIVWEKIPYETADEKELAEWIYYHRQKVIDGLTRKQSADLESGKVVPFSTIRMLKGGKNRK